MPGKVVNIRGTSGSGKSTVVNRIMDEWKLTAIYHAEKRRRPLGYSGVFRGKPLDILGHYEIPTGGCDTISSQDHIFSLARQAVENGMNVVMEGRILSCDFRRTVELAKDHEFWVLHIDIPVQEALEWVNHRRREKADREGKQFTPVNPKNTLSNDKSIRSACSRLKAQRINVRHGSREEVLAWTRELLS